MKPENISKLNKYFKENPKLQGLPCSTQEIEYAERLLELKFNEDYKKIIKSFGGCHIGIDIYAFNNSPILGKESVVDLTVGFREIVKSQQDSINYNNFLVVSDDGSGNAILVKHDSKKIYIYYHDQGLLETIFTSFDEIIEKFI